MYYGIQFQKFMKLDKRDANLLNSRIKHVSAKESLHNTILYFIYCFKMWVILMVLKSYKYDAFYYILYHEKLTTLLLM